jgi:hypothetical protein
MTIGGTASDIRHVELIYPKVMCKKPYFVPQYPKELDEFVPLEKQDTAPITEIRRINVEPEEISQACS